MSRAAFLPSTAPRMVILGLAFLALSGCSSGSMFSGLTSSGASPGPGPGDTRTDLATQLACRTRANEMYDRRNRAEIYAANSSVNSPFSANYSPGTTNRDLAGQFSFDQSVQECVRNAGTGSERSTTIEPAAPPPPVRRR